MKIERKFNLQALIIFVLNVIVWIVISAWGMGRATATVTTKITTEIEGLKDQVNRLESRIDQHIIYTNTLGAKPNGPQKNNN